MKQIRKIWNRWLVELLGGAIAQKVDRLDAQLQHYQQQNEQLTQQLQTCQAQIQQLTQQVSLLERCVQADPPKNSGLSLEEVDRQLSRIWQYYQHSKVQFEQINRQMQQHRSQSDEVWHKVYKQLGKIRDRHRTEMRDLKQQFDHLAFSGQPLRPLSVETDDGIDEEFVDEELSDRPNT